MLSPRPRERRLRECHHTILRTAKVIRGAEQLSQPFGAFALGHAWSRYTYLPEKGGGDTFSNTSPPPLHLPISARHHPVITPSCLIITPYHPKSPQHRRSHHRTHL
jgi:hypothetical protein